LEKSSVGGEGCGGRRRKRKERRKKKLNSINWETGWKGGGEEERIDNRRGEWAYKWVAGKKGGKGN